MNIGSDKRDKVQHVFLIGAKSLGAYGGYETFINKLTEYHQNNDKLQYHVACKANGDGCMKESDIEDVMALTHPEFFAESEFMYHNAHCYKLHVPSIGPAQAIYYDIRALQYCCRYIKAHHIEHAVVYIMACRIGPFMKHFCKKLHKLGAKLYVNPDGHEWMRAKWNRFIRRYWKLSEGLMVKHSDLVICDSVNIEKYIHECYDGRWKQNPSTTYIAYGAETRKSTLSDDDEELLSWYQEKQLFPKNYYLVVGRFVPENNYETMIREYMKSNTNKDFAIITNVNDKFLNELEDRLHYKKDDRIKFVGTVYDQELLMKIRENAYGYFHGHEVGGTNPSLLEALGSTRLNMLLKVGFNEEVALDSALYWTKEEGNLAKLIEQADEMTEEEIAQYGQKATNRVKEAYSWEYICSEYEKVFLQ